MCSLFKKMYLSKTNKSTYAKNPMQTNKKLQIKPKAKHPADKITPVLGLQRGDKRKLFKGQKILQNKSKKITL